MAATNYERYWRHISLADNDRSLRREGKTILIWRRYWKDYMVTASFVLHRFYKVYGYVLRPNTYIVDSFDTGETEHYSTPIYEGEASRFEAQRRLMQMEGDFARASGYFEVNGIRYNNLRLATQREWLESIEGNKKWFYFKRNDKEFVDDIRTEGEEWPAEVHPQLQGRIGG